MARTKKTETTSKEKEEIVYNIIDQDKQLVIDDIYLRTEICEYFQSLQEYVKKKSLKFIEILNHINQEWVFDTESESESKFENVSIDSTIKHYEYDFKSLHKKYVSEIYKVLSNEYNVKLQIVSDNHLTDRHFTLLRNGYAEVVEYKNIVKQIFDEKNLLENSYNYMVRCVQHSKYTIDSHVLTIKSRIRYTKSVYKETIKSVMVDNYDEIKIHFDLIKYLLTGSRFIADQYPIKLLNFSKSFDNLGFNNFTSFKYKFVYKEKWIIFEIVKKDICLTFSDDFLLNNCINIYI